MSHTVGSASGDGASSSLLLGFLTGVSSGSEVSKAPGTLEGVEGTGMVVVAGRVDVATSGLGDGETGTENLP